MLPSDLQKMRQTLKEAGLCAPPVPEELAPSLIERDKWFWATRDMDRGAMYSPPRYAIEVVAGPVEDYVALCHVGHGINSYEIVYHLVYGQLALFTGTSWGGGYMDAEKASATVVEQFGRCEELIALFQAKKEKSSCLHTRHGRAHARQRAAATAASEQWRQR